MADVLLVSAREDYIFAEGVAASLEQSGLSVAQTDGYTREGDSAPCVLVLWSIASGRSAAIRNMAVRAQHEGRLTAACLAGADAPLGFSRPKPFDLSQWDGDPNASALDAMFFAVDRVVCASRLNQGQARPPASSIAPLRPQSHPQQAPSRAPLSAAPPSARVTPIRSGRAATAASSQRYEAPAQDPNSPLVAEAAAWKRIEHSDDPADFLAYLHEYGAEGLFSELAQMRLDKLSAAPKPAKGGFMAHNPTPHMERPRPAPAPAPAPQRVRPAPPPVEEDRWRAEPRMEQPVRRQQAQGRRRPQPEVMAAAPPREDGGLRLGPILTIAALIAAAAAGFHFSRQSATPAPTEIAAAPTVEAPLDNNDFYTTAQPTAPAGQRTQIAAARPAVAAAAPKPRAPAPARPTTETRETAAYVPPPAPPITFRAPEPEAQAAPQPAPEPAPQPAAQPAAPAPSLYVAPTWIRRPTGSAMAQAYPAAAADRGVSGSATLDCAIQASGSLSCGVASETPARMGFGRAALSVASSFQAATSGPDGASLVGKRVRVPVVFKVAQ